ncbi:hypothetical protein [Hoeflea sp. TYP-13]|uniref:hypothetical protein n=1 Tax=Hoeflea sp. TYP-13 TaxID=3230023 RepID=UPI0034C646BF
MVNSGKMKFYTETAELRVHIENQYDLPISGRLNMPCTIFPGDPEIPTGESGFGEVIKIGVLGRQRSEKGSYRIPAILNHLRDLAAESGHNKEIRIVYQAVKTKRLRRFILELKTRLYARKNPDVGIEYLTSGVSEASFRKLLLEMDILLLPYDTHRYQFSGSGIIMDGVLGLKPIVHSRGMAMQELLSHDNCEAATTDREFAEKLLKVATQYQRYKQFTKNASAHAEKLLGESARSLGHDK